MAQDFYEVLGVERSASSKEIQAAYRRLARRYHPDVTGGDKAAEERFKAANEAHEVLSDAEKRAAYDRFGDQWMHADQLEQMEQQRGAFNPFGGAGRQGGATTFQFGGGVPFEESGGFSDAFERLFRGGGGRPAAPSRGADLEHPVQVSLTEAYHSTTRRIQVPAPGGGSRTQLEVTIPAGVETGSKVRLRGKGQAGINGGPSGDIILVVEVTEDHRFDRRGTALHTEVPVPLTRAVLGGEVEVPTLTGSVLLQIPEATQNGRVFRLNGKGMPVLNAERMGDLFAKVRIVLPEQLSDEERGVFERLRALAGESPTGDSARGEAAHDERAADEPGSDDRRSNGGANGAEASADPASAGQDKARQDEARRNDAQQDEE